YIDAAAPMDALGNPEPELTVSNIQVSGNLTAGGDLGFLAVTLSNFQLQIDPGVKLMVDIQPAPANPDTGETDGLVRPFDLGAKFLRLLKVDLQGANSGRDVAFSAEVDVTVPLLHAPLYSGQIGLVFPDVNNPARIDITGIDWLKDLIARAKQG